MTSSLLFLHLLQVGANGFALHLKNSIYKTINGQVLDSIQCIGMIFSAIPLDRAMVAGIISCLLPNCIFRV